MKKLLNVKNIYLVIFFLSISSLLSAIYIEYALEEKACILCIYQRIPYLMSIFVCFFGYNYYKNLFWLYLLSVIFIFSFLLSGYHVGIENNIFQEFSGCTNSNINLIDKDELLKSLVFERPNCKDVNFKLFGLSLASINLIISITISMILILKIKNEKNR